MHKTEVEGNFKHFWERSAKPILNTKKLLNGADMCRSSTAFFLQNQDSVRCLEGILYVICSGNLIQLTLLHSCAFGAPKAPLYICCCHSPPPYITKAPIQREMESANSLLPGVGHRLGAAGV